MLTALVGLISVIFGHPHNGDHLSLCMEFSEKLGNVKGSLHVIPEGGNKTDQVLRKIRALNVTTIESGITLSRPKMNNLTFIDANDDIYQTKNNEKVTEYFIQPSSENASSPIKFLSPMRVREFTRLLKFNVSITEATNFSKNQFQQKTFGGILTQLEINRFIRRNFFQNTAACEAPRNGDNEVRNINSKDIPFEMIEDFFSTPAFRSISGKQFEKIFAFFQTQENTSLTSKVSNLMLKFAELEESQNKKVSNLMEKVADLEESHNYMLDNFNQKGVPGDIGPPGEMGPPGLEGIEGATGLAGETGPEGATGQIGVKGATGETGPEGATGQTGVEGATGEIGPEGATGQRGVEGATGETGPEGATGQTGVEGATGETGPEGATGKAGSSAWKMVGSDEITAENNLLTKVGSSGWENVISYNPLPSRGVFQFEIEYVKIGEIVSSYSGLMFGLSSSITPIPNGDIWNPSAIMFNANTGYRGMIMQQNSLSTRRNSISNFLSEDTPWKGITPWRDGDRAGVSINIDTNEIDWYYKGDVIWTTNTKEECNFEIGDKHHPTVSMGYTGLQARVHFDGPFENF